MRQKCIILERTAQHYDQAHFRGYGVLSKLHRITRGTEFGIFNINTETEEPESEDSVACGGDPHQETYTVGGPGLDSDSCVGVPGMPKANGAVEFQVGAYNCGEMEIDEEDPYSYDKFQSDMAGL